MNQGVFSKFFGTKSEIAIVLFMVAILVVLFTPIPSAFLDFLLILNLSFGLLLLLLTFYIEKPIEFSTFPSLLLIATLFRLSLNIAATRLILSDGDAGDVIHAVGTYVVGGNYIIGLVVFFILIIVQYVVVTNGAQRVAEVAARFTLDSMPGKQMSIDADLNMGLIDEKEAQNRRKEIEKEASFYGAMDGASKFVKGDAIAGILIILIDIIGGLTIGLAQMGMSWGDALHTYTLLTVGDGIVTQIPALVISTATGIIVTRAATDAVFGAEVTKQVTQYPKILFLVSLALLVLLILPGIPFFPVLVILAIVGTLTYFAFKHYVAEDNNVDAETTETGDEQSDLYQQLQVEAIEIVIGRDLIDLAGGDQSNFMEKVKSFRKQFAMEKGFVIPSVRIRDDVKQDDLTYEVKIFGSRVAHGEIYPECVLAISAQGIDESLPGVKTQDPSYGLPAIWLEEQHRSVAKSNGYTLVEPATVLITHFSETVRNHAPELLTRSATEQLVERVKTQQPSLYDELLPNVLSLSDIQKILQGLLTEKISIRNIELVLEALVDQGKQTKEPDVLIEVVRQKLGREICESLLNKEGQLHVLTLDPTLEQALQNGLRNTETNTTLLVDPKLTEGMLAQLGHHVEKMMADSLRSVLLCSPSLRRHIRKLTERVLPHLSVLSLKEIPSMVDIKSFDIVRVDGINRSTPTMIPKGGS